MLYNKGLQANCRVKGETMVQKAHSYQKQSGTVSITLCLILSTDEKLSSERKPLLRRGVMIL